jgi:hypothetical protein
MESSVLLGEGLKKLIDTPGALKVVLKRPELNVADAGAVDPLAFPVGHPEHPIPVTIGPAGVDVDTSSWPAGGNVVVNWLWYPPMRADAGGMSLNCSADELGRIVVAVPSSGSEAVTAGRTIHVRYHPNWMMGVEIGAALAAASVLLCAVLQWLGLERPHRTTANQKTTPAPVIAALSN